MSRDASPVRGKSKELKEVTPNFESDALYTPDDKTLEQIRIYQSIRSNYVNLETCDSTYDNLRDWLTEHNKQKKRTKKALQALEEINLEIGKRLPILCKAGSFTFPLLNGKNPLSKRVISRISPVSKDEVCDFQQSTFQ